MITFEGCTTVVTGAASGIGRATAELFGRHGARLFLADRDAPRLEDAARVIDPTGERVAHGVLDVASAEQCERVMADATRRFGGIHHLVHAAGVYPEALVRDATEAQWRRLTEVNLDGTFHACRAVLPHLVEGSAIVLLSSMAAHRGSYAHAAYAASKGAVLSFARSLAQELAPRTRVNAVSPGIIRTGMTTDLVAGERGSRMLANTPMGRHGEPEEVAGAIAFLCSGLAGFVTGQTVHVNGGLYMG